MNISGINSGLTELVKRLQKTSPQIKIQEKNAQTYENINKKMSEYFPDELDYKSQKFKKQYYSPNDIANKLSEKELDELKKVHSLISEFETSDIDLNGDHNIINYKDTNNSLSLKETVTNVFPPKNAPDYVKEAWQESTKDMSPVEKMKAESTFWVLEIKANLKYDASGNVSGIKSPVDSDYTNIYSQKDTNFFQLVNEYKAYLKHIKSEMKKDEYNEKKSFIEDYEKNLYEKKPTVSLSA